MSTTDKILVLKLEEDLASFVTAFAAMRQIREAHPKAKITLLTTPPFGPISKASGYFNTVDTLGDLDPMSLSRSIRAAKYARVYDLDQSAKSHRIHSLMWPFRPPWAGKGRLKDRTPGLERMHPLERQASLLKAAGAWPDAPMGPGDAPPPDLSWILKIAPAATRLKPYVLMAPGAADEARWPTEKFGELAVHFRGLGYDNVVIGGLKDGAFARQIQRFDPTTRDLTGRTDFAQLGVLSAKATLAVGNACSSLHLAVAAGAPTIAFYPASADLAATGPRGHVAVLQDPDLARITVAQVARTAANMSPDLAMAS